MGSLKNEAFDKIKSKLSKEDLEKQIALDGGELYFDECQILAPKVYSLKKTLFNGVVIEIAKSKGCKKSSYAEQGKLLSGEIIKSTITQFRSGKGAYMSEDSFGKVFVTDVTKQISMYDEEGECKYSKGKVVDIHNKERENWEVVPHLFIAGVKQNE